MHVLLLAKKNPYPDRDGEAIAVLQMAKGLAEAGCEVSVLYMNTPKHHCAVTEIPAALRKKITFYAVEVNNAVTAVGAIQSLVQRIPYHVNRFYSVDFKNKLLQLVQQHSFDIIQAEGLYLVQYFTALRIHTHAKLIYRSHNIEAEIWQNIGDNSAQNIKKWYLRKQAKKLLQYEKQITQFIDAIVPIATADAIFYKQLNTTMPVHHAPTGVQLSATVAESATINYNTLYFIGGLDWLPNVEGLQWFIHQVFATIQQQFPNVILHIAGRNGSNNWQQLNNTQIIYHGEVDDAAAFASDKYICVVPLLSGSGMKIKIIEAMHLGKPVITTQKGAKGMPDGIAAHIYIAHDAAQFITLLQQLLNNNNEAILNAKKAQQFVINTLSNRQIANQLIQFYQTLQQQ